MRGRIKSWKDDRGFGFIEPESGGENVFFHISGMARGAPRPTVGQVVSFEMVTSPNGKARGVKVGPVGLAAVSNILMSKRVLLSVIALLIFPLLWWLMKLGMISTLTYSVLSGMSIMTFFMYGVDKWAAMREAQRTPENSLQFCALIGGWPGALLAQQVFMHKTSKRSFQITFRVMVMVNCVMVGLLSSPTGAVFLRQLLKH